MSQYKKIFNTAEIEYLTPFFKLWMSFNNWYKQDLVWVSKDSEAINYYKETWKIKDEFLRFFSLNSDIWLEFQNALYNLVLNIRNYQLKYPNWDLVKYDDWLILENADSRWWKEPIYISIDKKRFQILEENKEYFFKQTLNIIYQIRCTMVHWDYDVENIYFNKLVECAYKILYPILDKIIQESNEWEFICESAKKYVKATWVFNDWKMTVFAGSQVSKVVVPSFWKEDTEERNKLLSQKCIENDNFFELKENIDFSSPSSASSFCLWSSSNGWNDWKNRDWKTMSDILRNNQ